MVDHFLISTINCIFHVNPLVCFLFRNVSVSAGASGLVMRRENQRVRTGVGLHFVSAGNLISHMPSSYKNKVQLAVIIAKTRENNTFDVKYCWELCRRPVKEGDSENSKKNTDSSIFIAFSQKRKGFWP